MQESPVRPFHLSVSIVTYNNAAEMLRRVLCSLQVSAENARDAGLLERVDVILVDNSSDSPARDGLSALVGSWMGDDFFRIDYRKQPENLGFGVGHNSVLPALSSDVHLVLNPDAELAKDALKVGLLTLEEEPDIALLSPRVAAEDGRQEFLCKRYPTVLVLALRAFAPGFVQRLFQRRLDHYEMRDRCAGDTPVDVVLASGCFMLVRTYALRTIGGFSHDYFLYFEDFDLCLRLREQGRLVFEPAMRIVHHGGYAARKGLQHVRYFVRSGITFFNQHGWRWI
jgi:GT2 family glycosyltransferase